MVRGKKGLPDARREREEDGSCGQVLLRRKFVV